MSVHDRWGPGAKTGPGQRWEVRYREAGRQRKRRFALQKTAEKFDAKQKLDPHARNEVEGRTLTVGQMVDTWLATKARLKPKTIEACRLDAGEVRKAFGDRIATQVRNSEVRVWVARDRGTSIRRRSLAALRQAYRLAIADELVTRDPTAGIPLPKTDESDKRALSWDELEHLADAAGEYAPMIWLLGTCGLRIGEAARLDVADVGKKRLRVRKSKTGKPRDVPIMPSVRAMLDLSRPGPLFRSPSGLRVNPHHWRARVFDVAADRAGFGKLTIVRAKPYRGRPGRTVSTTYVGITPHELRHTAASLAVQAGADVTVVARMLGHSPEVCLKIYAHLFDGSLDSVIDRMDAARNGGAEVIRLDPGAPRAPHAMRST